MRWVTAGLALVVSCLPLPAKHRVPTSPMPDTFVIGRATHFDFGPPNDYYEVIVVSPISAGTAIDRVILTPETKGHECVAPAKVEVSSAKTTESVSSLLGSRNPCSIPEKTIRRELSRKKKGLVFSFAEIVMQVQCETRTRLIRADILDRDMFDPAPSTPAHTSWTMRLLNSLDALIGPGVMDKPMFPIPEANEITTRNNESQVLKDVASGKYDALFGEAAPKPSEIYRTAQRRPPPPTVRFTENGDLPPDALPVLGYPPIAWLAQIEGVVSFKLDIDEDGVPGNIVFESGHPILRKVVQALAKDWRFPKGPPRREVPLKLDFSLNCHPTKN
jgi:hypothetical protein